MEYNFNTNLSYRLPDKSVYNLIYFIGNEKITKEIVVKNQFRKVKKFFGLKKVIEIKNPFTNKWERYL